MALSISEMIALIGVILFIGFFAEQIFRRFSIPNIVILLIIGLILGPLTNTLPSKDLSGYASLFSPIALIIILFQGGLNMRIKSFLKGSPRAFLLSITNVVISVIVVSLIGRFVFGWDFLLGAILGAIIGGTSSPIVIPLVSEFKLHKDMKNIITLESISTDVVCIVFAIVLINYMLGAYSMSGSDPLGVILKNIFTAFSTGIVIGIIGALVWTWILKNSIDIEFDYVLTLGVLFILYYLSEYFGGNGAISSLIFGLVIGNIANISSFIRTDMFNIKSAPIKQFHKEIYFFIDTFFLVYLGTIVVLNNYQFLIIGVLLSMILIALRYMTVPLLMYNTKCPRKEIDLMSVISARGLAAAVLAPLPFTYGIASAQPFPDIVFAVILTTVASTTLGYMIIKYKSNKEAKPESYSQNDAEVPNTG